MRAIGATLMVLALASVGAAAQSPQAPRTVVPEHLGIPSAERWPNEYYPRNVWDMQVYGRHLYLGAGNSSNFGPSPNAGPVPIVRYGRDGFENVFTAREEQVASFGVFGGSLYVPGHDSRQGWELGNLYQFNPRGWRMFRAIPNGIHVFDVYKHRRQFIAVGGARNQEIDAWVAPSEEGPWRVGRFIPIERLVPQATVAPSLLGNGRLVTLFEIGDTLYASGVERLRYASTPQDLHLIVTLFQFDGQDGFIPIAAAPGAAGQRIGVDLFPDAEMPQTNGVALPQVRRAVRLGGQTFYLGAVAHNDSQWIPFGVFAASNLDDVRRVATPEGTQIYDLLAREGRLYALGNVRLAEDRYEVQLLRLRDDGTTLEMLARFASPTFARSFEFYRGDWFFGLGSEVSVEDTRLARAEAERVDWRQRLSEETGAILRVRGDAVE